jgi:AhpC/TSA family
MRLRLLLPLLTLAIPVAIAQSALYGPVTAHVRAGDSAPDIAATLLSSPDSAPWSQSSLAGRFTVIAFIPNTTLNLRAVFVWNQLVDKFKDRPIQFLWITGEADTTLKPWLEDHPIKGWLLHDPQGTTGHNFGLELPVAAYIGPDSKIIGFSANPPPDENTVNAVLDNRTTTTRPTPDTQAAFNASKMVLLDPEPRRAKTTPPGAP